MLLASKYQSFADIAEQQAQQVTQSMSDWTSFLNTAGRLYKYPFEEQLMIHAQRPDAIACAPIELWNKPMHRYVKRGSKGIALLDNTGDKPKLKYVFDVGDTQDGWQNPRRPFLWEMKQEHETTVVRALKDTYKIDDQSYLGWDANNGTQLLGNSLGDYLYSIAQTISARYYEDNKRDISYAVEDSFLHGLDAFNVGVAFRDALTVSTTYALMNRCGIDSTIYIENEDFQSVFDFNSHESVYALGKAVSDVSEEVLREIEVTIKNYERQKAVEMEGQGHEHSGSQQQRNDVQRERRLSDTRHSDTSTNPLAREVRHNAEGLSQPAQGGIVHDLYTERDSVPSLLGNRESSQSTAGVDGGGTVGTNTTTEQANRPDGLDSTHEQLENPSRGSHSQGLDLQLKPDDEGVGETPTPLPPTDNGISNDNYTNIQSQQLSLFPSEQEQIEIVRGTLQADVITQVGIDNAITAWNGDIESKVRVFEYMNEHARIRDTANFLKAEYGGDMGGFAVTKDGIEPISLPWAKVQRRIAQLMDEDKFLSTDERMAADNALGAEWERLVEENAQPSATKPLEQTQAADLPQEPLGSPPPVFVVNWNTAQHDFHFNLYKDRDVIAYDLEGVEHRIGRSGDLTYVSSTGAFWGSNSVPGDIYEQIEAYRNGELSDEGVRENYLSILNAYKQAPLAEVTLSLPEEPSQGSPRWQLHQTPTAANPDKIIFIQNHSGYEVMGDRANEIANLLNIGILSRDVGLSKHVRL